MISGKWDGQKSSLIEVVLAYPSSNTPLPYRAGNL
jgi:hypothetical protein